jgi:tRNA threonylcarbamoyladenosine biosynthesis protein TsaB
MTILALEFSSVQRSAAVVARGADGAPVVLGTASESGATSVRALALVENALRAARLEREAIDGVAVGLGPGSYTGIRVAISLAQGWQLARPVRLRGLSSVECLAEQARVEGLTGRVTILLDAQRGELYVAGYEIGTATRRELEPLRLATWEEVEPRLRLPGTVLGPEVTRWWPRGRKLCPSAAALGVLASTRADDDPGEQLEPIYLRAVNFVKAPAPRLVI